MNEMFPTSAVNIRENMSTVKPIAMAIGMLVMAVRKNSATRMTISILLALVFGIYGCLIRRDLAA